jgi:2-dehydro-3-deoxyphosphogluconate aldolase/(4S)-4-hydroxy-2-oxoglutarate aldolase
MARYDRLTVLSNILELGLVPVFYHPDAAVAIKIGEACAAGGATAIECTNRGDYAPEIFLKLSTHLARSNPDIILGVGSIVDGPTAAMYIAYGANFVVGPVLNPEVARICNRRKIAYCPGCGSASEISQAEELGVEIVKIFPGASVGGVDFVKAILGPCPWSLLMPTGGVEATHDSITEWFSAGVACVGMGSKLITQECIDSGDYDTIAAKVNQTLEWIREARGR